LPVAYPCLLHHSWERIKCHFHPTQKVFGKLSSGSLLWRRSYPRKIR
jgi:hypothetical protein